MVQCSAVLGFAPARLGGAGKPRQCENDEMARRTAEKDTMSTGHTANSGGLLEPGDWSLERLLGLEEEAERASERDRTSTISSPRPEHEPGCILVWAEIELRRLGIPRPSCLTAPRPAPTPAPARPPAHGQHADAQPLRAVSLVELLAVW